MRKFIIKSTLPEFINCKFVCEYEGDDPSTLKFRSSDKTKWYTDKLNEKLSDAVIGNVFRKDPKTGKNINREQVKRIVDIVDGIEKSKTGNTLSAFGI
ncbi:hypothetical protein [Aeromonas jandaei]|uniref:hypothetical protein n=1 Tax=Aeromonas jandaei TaxID=650 RepID=UPI00366D613B